MGRTIPLAPPVWLRTPWRGIKRILRSPRVIIAELLTIAAAGVVMSFVPQSGLDDAARPDGVVRLLDLDRVARSAWFLAVVFVASLSLAIVIVELVKRLVREWSLVPGADSFASAPLRREFVRATRPGAPPVTIHTTGRLGLAGAATFHVGLMGLIVAGLGAMLFGVDAQVDLLEGETLAAEPHAWGAQWAGPLGRPLTMPWPIRLDRLGVERYPSGDLQAMEATLTLLEPEHPRQVPIAINAPLELGGNRLYLTSLHGPAALLQIAAGGVVEKLAVVLRETTRGFEGQGGLADGTQVRVRALSSRPDVVPEQVELRLLRDDALLASEVLETGKDTPLPQGSARLVGGARWVRFTAARDLSLALAWLGLALITLGASLMFLVIRVDTAILVTPVDGGERVVVAIRPARFPAAFEDRLQQLVREQGGAP